MEYVMYGKRDFLLRNGWWMRYILVGVRGIMNCVLIEKVDILFDDVFFMMVFVMIIDWFVVKVGILR